MRRETILRLFVLAALVGTLTGCVSTKRIACDKKFTIKFVIDGSGQTSPTVDKQVEVCKGFQDVEWYSKDAQWMKVTVLKGSDHEKPPKGDEGEVDETEPQCVKDLSNGGFLCTLLKTKHKTEGWVRYKIDLRDAEGKPRPVDPYLIIRK